jgi:hypothetical protein
LAIWLLRPDPPGDHRAVRGTQIGGEGSRVRHRTGEQPVRVGAGEVGCRVGGFTHHQGVRRRGTAPERAEVRRRQHPQEVQPCLGGQPAIGLPYGFGLDRGLERHVGRLVVGDFCRVAAQLDPAQWRGLGADQQVDR